MKEFRYLVDGKPASDWFSCFEHTIEDMEMEEIYLTFKDVENWQIEYRG